MKTTFRPLYLAGGLFCVAGRAGADGSGPLAQPGVAPGAVSGMAAKAPGNVSTGDLPIPAFSRGKLRIEIDATDGDLLGVVKSFFEGINPRTLQALAPARMGVEGAAPGPAAGELRRVLSQTDLRSLFANVRHIHFVSYELPYQPEPDAEMATAPLILPPMTGGPIHPMPPRPMKAMPPESGSR